MQWFVVKVRTAFEKKVKAQLEEQIELKELKDQFGRILVPIEEMVVARGEKKKRYIFHRFIIGSPSRGG